LDDVSRTAFTKVVNDAKQVLVLTDENILQPVKPAFESSDYFNVITTTINQNFALSAGFGTVVARRFG
jgi:methyl-accepting chemotaxis protein